MPVYISLLRGINVGGHRKIKMADLSALYESLGLESVQTLLQSGNAVFASDENDPVQLKQRIETGIEQQFGFGCDVMMRTMHEFRALVDRNPFLAEGTFDPKKLLVMFLAEGPEAEAINSLVTSYAGPESIQVDGREAYLYYPDGMGRSKLTNALIEKHLGVSSTGRNWNTVVKLIELAERFEPR